MVNKVIAIGAHPDDIEIGAAGTIKKFSNSGAEVFFLIATYGENSHPAPALQIEQRKKESIASAEYLGVKQIFFLNLHDTKIEHNGMTVSAIEKYINLLDPNFVLTHTKEDGHQDHKNLAFSTISACRRKKINILHYETPSTAQTFLPTLYSDISDTIKYKLETLKMFVSQNHKNYLDPEVIKGLSQYRGYTSGSEYAEGFEVSKFYLNDF